MDNPLVFCGGGGGEGGLGNPLLGVGFQGSQRGNPRFFARGGSVPLFWGLASREAKGTTAFLFVLGGVLF